MDQPRRATRPSHTTRDKIVKAAAHVFAQHGYEGASVRAIVARADVNQAAINYHFGSKEALYRAVLEEAMRAQLRDEETAAEAGALSREERLRAFIARQLRPMISRDELSDYVRIFNWETLRPSETFRTFMAEAAPEFFTAATGLVRQFLPAGASERHALLGTLWLLGQCSVFVRNAEHLANPPLGFTVDQRFVAALADILTVWAAGGMGGLPADSRV
jgi:AcrR family transcriptional regulator